MDEFPKNSRRIPAQPEEKKEPKKVERVTTTDPIRRKQTLGKRFMATFFGGDAKGVVRDVITSVLVPAAKDMLADAVSQGFEQLIYGEARSRSRRPPFRPDYSTATKVPYNRYSQPVTTQMNYRPGEARPISRQARSSHDFDEIILSTRVEGEEVIDRLFDLISRYEMATVSELYELVGITGSFTDEKWGWTDLRGTDLTRCREGYLINLPKPEPLN